MQFHMEGGNNLINILFFSFKEHQRLNILKKEIGHVGW